MIVLKPQTFAAVKVYFLGYMFSQSTNEGQFPDFSAAIRNRLENNLKSHVTSSWYFISRMEQY